MSISKTGDKTPKITSDTSANSDLTALLRELIDTVKTLKPTKTDNQNYSVDLKELTEAVKALKPTQTSSQDYSKDHEAEVNRFNKLFKDLREARE